MSARDAEIDKSQVHDLDETGYQFLATFIVVADGSIGLNWNKNGLDLLAENNVTVEAMESVMTDLIARSLTEGTEQGH